MCAQYNIRGRAVKLKKPEGQIFLLSLYFSAAKNTVQLSLGTAGMRNSGHVTTV